MSHMARTVLRPSSPLHPSPPTSLLRNFKTSNFVKHTGDLKNKESELA